MDSIFLEIRLIFKKIHYLLTRTPKKALCRFGTVGIPDTSEKEFLSNMRYALLKHGLYYEEFFLYGLYNCKKSDYGSFIGEIERYRLFEHYNDKTEKKLFRDKCAQYEKYKEFYGRECLCVYSKKDFEKFKSFCCRYEKIVLKPACKSCGHGVSVLEKGSFDIREVFTEYFAYGKFICEEYIVQSDFFSRLNAQSLNTVRFVSDPSGKNPLCLSPFLRIGRYTKHIDNAGAGGIFCTLDRYTGKVTSIGRDENGAFYPYHPDSKVALKNLQIPEWDNLLKLINQIQAKTKSRLISYDAAHSTCSGWVLVEANYAGQLLCQQTALSKEILQENKNDSEKFINAL